VYKKASGEKAEPTVLTTTRLDPDTRAVLEELAWSNRTSLSYETKEAIRRGLLDRVQEVRAAALKKAQEKGQLPLDPDDLI
jgi:predicted transcriptional regulator